MSSRASHRLNSLRAEIVTATMVKAEVVDAKRFVNVPGVGADLA